MTFIEQCPYPLDDPMGQELLRVMAGIYRRENDALRFVAPMGVDALEVTPGLAPINLWTELLQKLAVAGTVGEAVQRTRNAHPNNPHIGLFDALLERRQAPANAAPMTPTFDDRVSEPEALLFHDDLTMAAGDLPKLIRTLVALRELIAAVCLLRVENAHGRFFGTGFRFSRDWILTNHHVLFPKDSVATKVHADFDFDVNEHGATTPVTSLPAWVDSIQGESGDDWAIVRVDNMDASWPILPLDGAPPPAIGDPAYIIQHPSGGQKRLGYVRNTISEITPGLVRYLTDTEPGSSGAPVFDAKGGLIALHHAGGTPMEVVGKPPIAKNEGVRISRVRERLLTVGWKE